MNTLTRSPLLLLLLGLAAATLLAACAAPPSTASPTAHSPTQTEPPAASASPTTAPPAATTAQPSAPAPTRTFSLLATPERETMPASPASPLPQSPALRLLIDPAIQDLAARLNLPADQIEFIQFEPVVWPDGSLGCPQPDREYIQVQVEGYRIRLRANGQEYAYHGGGRTPPFLCPQAPQ